MKRIILTGSVLALVGLTLVGIRSDAQRPYREPRTRVEIVSITKAGEPVREEGAPFAVAEYVITIRNRSAKEALAVSFAQKHGRRERGITDFLFDGQLQPGTEMVRRMRLPVEDSQGAVQLKSVVFSDASHEGDDANSNKVIAIIDEAVRYHRGKIAELRALAATPDAARIGAIKAGADKHERQGLAVGLYERAYADAYNLLMTGRREQAREVLEKAAAQFERAFSHWELK